MFREEICQPTGELKPGLIKQSVLHFYLKRFGSGSRSKCNLIWVHLSVFLIRLEITGHGSNYPENWIRIQRSSNNQILIRLDRITVRENIFIYMFSLITVLLCFIDYWKNLYSYFIRIDWKTRTNCP